MSESLLQSIYNRVDKKQKQQRNEKSLNAKLSKEQQAASSLRLNSTKKKKLPPPCSAVCSDSPKICQDKLLQMVERLYPVPQTPNILHSNLIAANSTTDGGGGFLPYIQHQKKNEKKLDLLSEYSSEEDPHLLWFWRNRCIEKKTRRRKAIQDQFKLEREFVKKEAHRQATAHLRPVNFFQKREALVKEEMHRRVIEKMCESDCRKDIGTMMGQEQEAMFCEGSFMSHENNDFEVHETSYHNSFDGGEGKADSHGYNSDFSPKKSVSSTPSNASEKSKGDEEDFNSPSSISLDSSAISDFDDN